MRLHDVNILVYAHREESAEHDVYKAFLDNDITSGQAYGVSDMVINGFLRLVTNRKAYPVPTPLSRALGFADQIRHQPGAVLLAPGHNHWSIFTKLCTQIHAAHKDLPDAYLAALAIEYGCEFVTNDRRFKRFHGLRLVEV